MLRSVRPSVRPSVCSMNTNRKPHAGSRTHWSAWPPELAETTIKPSPEVLQKHSLGGYTVELLSAGAHRFTAQTLFLCALEVHLLTMYFETHENIHEALWSTTA